MHTKIIRKISFFCLTLCLFLSVTACGGNVKEDPDDGEVSVDVASDSDESDAQVVEENSSPDESAASDGYAKFSQLAIGMTESEVNAILGEPAEVDKAYYYYNIMVNGQEMQIQVWINTTSGMVTYFGGSFEESSYRAEFADSETDLSAADGLDSGELSTYEECVAAFKTAGYLISLDEDGVARYLWVDANDGHICITFREDGTVKSYVGYC